MKVIIYADGGSRGNPGVAGSGTVVYAADGTTILREIVYVVGTKATNNVAEYHGLLRGLEAASDLGASEVEFYMDSKLVVEQINGRWKIKHPDMQKLALKARTLIDGFSSFSLDWVPRAKNKVADALSNDAMDAAAAGHKVGIVKSETDEPAAESSSDAAPGESTPVEGEKEWDASAPHPSDWLGERGDTTRFILLRHGQTEMSAAKQYSGRANPELTELGKKQALAAAQALAGTTIDAIVCSPLKRCQETAAAVAHGRDIEVVTEEGLSEVDFGEWEGKTAAEAHQRDPEIHEQWLHDAATPCPGGESLQAVNRRVRAVRKELQRRYSGKTVLIVSHVNPIKSFLCQALNAGPATFQHLFLDLAALSDVEFWDGGSMVHGFNDVGHLEGLR